MSRTAIAIVVGIGIALVVLVAGIGALFSFGPEATIGWITGIVNAIFPLMIFSIREMGMIFMFAKRKWSPNLVGIVVVMVIMVISLDIIVIRIIIIIMVIMIIIVMVIIIIIGALTFGRRNSVIIVVVVCSNLLFGCNDFLEFRNGTREWIMVEQAVDCSSLTVVDTVHDNLLDVIIGELKIGSIRDQQSFTANRTDTGNEDLSAEAILVFGAKRTEVLKDSGSGTSRKVLGD